MCCYSSQNQDQLHFKESFSEQFYFRPLSFFCFLNFKPGMELHSLTLSYRGWFILQNSSCWKWRDLSNWLKIKHKRIHFFFTKLKSAQPTSTATEYTTPSQFMIKITSKCRVQPNLILQLFRWLPNSSAGQLTDQKRVLVKICPHLLVAAV